MNWTVEQSVHDGDMARELYRLIVASLIQKPDFKPSDVNEAVKVALTVSEGYLSRFGQQDNVAQLVVNNSEEIE